MVNIEDSKRTQSLTATGIRDSTGMCCLSRVVDSLSHHHESKLFDKLITSS